MSIRTITQDVRIINKFSDRPVSSQWVLDMLEDAVWAPNHKFREPWRFIYANGSAKESLVKALIKEQHNELAETIQQAPVSLIVAVPTNQDEHVAKDDFAAACCLIRNIQLLCWPEGIGVYWGAGEFAKSPEVLSFASIGPHERIAAILGLGYADEQAVAPQQAVPNLPEDILEYW
jgi:nitroreductase